jgi:hypothetical protein
VKSDSGYAIMTGSDSKRGVPWENPVTVMRMKGKVMRDDPEGLPPGVNFSDLSAKCSGYWSY